MIIVLDPSFQAVVSNAQEACSAFAKRGPSSGMADKQQHPQLLAQAAVVLTKAYRTNNGLITLPSCISSSALCSSSNLNVVNSLSNGNLPALHS